MARRLLASVAVAAVALAALSGCVLWPQSVKTDDTEFTEEITSVSIAGDSGSVTITGERGLEGATVHRDIRFLGTLSTHDSHRVEDGTLVLEDCGRNCSVSYTVTVPAGVPVRGSTSNGSITLENLGSVDVRTSNGAVLLTDIDGTIRARSSNGRISGSGLGGDRIDVETSNGAIDLTLRTPQDVTASTSNGRITLTVPDGSYAVSAEAGNGSEDIDIATDPRGDHRLDLRTSNGSIEVRPA